MPKLPPNAFGYDLVLSLKSTLDLETMRDDILRHIEMVRSGECEYFYDDIALLTKISRTLAYREKVKAKLAEGLV